MRAGSIKHESSRFVSPVNPGLWELVSPRGVVAMPGSRVGSGYLFEGDDLFILTPEVNKHDSRSKDNNLSAVRSSSGQARSSLYQASGGRVDDNLSARLSD
ncbi:hypothetical protein Bbelb_244060 [Branchiostoma belcheri]|nr:hypothetical protein Bbelb_244060 [Branchiostoma belcheri]